MIRFRVSPQPLLRRRERRGRRRGSRFRPRRFRLFRHPPPAAAPATSILRAPRRPPRFAGVEARVERPRGSATATARPARARRRNRLRGPRSPRGPRRRRRRRRRPCRCRPCRRSSPAWSTSPRDLFAHALNLRALWTRLGVVGTPPTRSFASRNAPSRPSSRSAFSFGALLRSSSRSALSQRSSRLVGRFRRFSPFPPRLSPWPPTCAARSNARPWPSPASPSTPSPVAPTHHPAPSPSRLRCRRRARTPPPTISRALLRTFRYRRRRRVNVRSELRAPTIAPPRPRPRTPPHETPALVDVLAYGLAPGHRRRRRRVRGLVVEVQVRRALWRRRRAERRRRFPPVARGRRFPASVRGRGAGPRLARLRLALAAVPVVFTGYRRAVTLHHRVAPSQEVVARREARCASFGDGLDVQGRPRPRGAAVRSVALP